MKKLLTLLFIVWCGAAMAQNHMKFMGIPLTGSVDAFVSKLSAKGCTVSTLNRQAPAGTRVLEGTFSGEEATICVYYNPSNKTVNSAKAYMRYYGKSRVEDKQAYFETLLDKKYPTAQKTVDVKEDDYGHTFSNTFYLITENGQAIGAISLYIRSEGYTDTDAFTLHLEYSDAEGLQQAEDAVMEDL